MKDEDDPSVERARLCVELATSELARKGVHDLTQIENLALEHMERTDSEIDAALQFQKQITKDEGGFARRRAVLQRHATSHGGLMAIADAIEQGNLSREEFQEAVSNRKAVEAVESMLRNPCSICESVRLAWDWVGTGYCSLACCEKAKRSGNARQREYAASMYDEWMRDNQ